MERAGGLAALQSMSSASILQASNNDRHTPTLVHCLPGSCLFKADVVLNKYEIIVYLVGRGCCIIACKMAKNPLKIDVHFGQKAVYAASKGESLYIVAQCLYIVVRDRAESKVTCTRVRYVSDLRYVSKIQTRYTPTYHLQWKTRLVVQFL